ncbi:MAG: hypothetical protein J0L86_07925 [Flavobacteriales bacterium]|nr:hypothetical protein [Flavobacteriales bacterium]
MKKITFILAFIGMIGLQSCTVNEVNDDGIDNDTISEVLEVTTSFSAGNNFSRLVTINPPIYASDMILVYHLYDVVNGADVWRLMPQTYYFDGGGELDYNFDFTRYDVSLFMDANFDMTTLSSAWTQNQTFRIVIVPGYFSGKISGKADFTDYNATLKAFNIDPSKVRKIKA